MHKSIKILVLFLLYIFLLFSNLSFEYSQNDVELLAKLIEAEASGEPYNGMIAVGNVVLNRLNTGLWGDSIEKVIYSKNQFASPCKTYSETCYEAAKDVLNGVKILPENILFFQRAKTNYFYAPWYCTIGNHNFYGTE